MRCVNLQGTRDFCEKSLILQQKAKTENNNLKID